MNKRYISGLSSEVRDWIHQREDQRAAKDSCNGRVTIPCHIQYKFRSYWDKQVYHIYETDDCSEMEEYSNIAIKNEDEFRNYFDQDYEQGLLCAIYAHHTKFLEHVLFCFPRSVRYAFPKSKRTMLHLAVLNGDFVKVEMLLDNKAKIDAVDIKHQTPLFLSLNEPRRFHSIEIVKKLISSGADVNIADSRGFSPLHQACLLNDEGLILLLLRSRAQVFALDKKGKLPIEYCKLPNCKALFDDNVRFCGRKQHTKMWAHLMSRVVVRDIMNAIEPSCGTCLRKLGDCSQIKKSNYRYWLFTHKRFAVK